jgi:hypothetical protein
MLAFSTWHLATVASLSEAPEAGVVGHPYLLCFMNINANCAARTLYQEQHSLLKTASLNIKITINTTSDGTINAVFSSTRSVAG